MQYLAINYVFNKNAYSELFYLVYGVYFAGLHQFSRKVFGPSKSRLFKIFFLWWLQKKVFFVFAFYLRANAAADPSSVAICANHRRTLSPSINLLSPLLPSVTKDFTPANYDGRWFSGTSQSKNWRWRHMRVKKSSFFPNLWLGRCSRGYWIIHRNQSIKYALLSIIMSHGIQSNHQKPFKVI